MSAFGGVVIKGWVQALTGQHLSPAVALGRLEDMFDGNAPKRQQPMTIILADEIDMLVTRNQQVFTFFLLTSRKSSGRAQFAKLAVAVSKSTANNQEAESLYGVVFYKPPSNDVSRHGGYLWSDDSQDLNSLCMDA